MRLILILRRLLNALQRLLFKQIHHAWNTKKPLSTLLSILRLRTWLRREPSQKLHRQLPPRKDVPELPSNTSTEKSDATIINTYAVYNDKDHSTANQITCSIHPYSFAGRNTSRSSQNLVTATVEMQNYSITYPVLDRHLLAPTPRRGFGGSTPYLPRPNSTVTNLPLRPRTASPAPVHFVFSEASTVNNQQEPEVLKNIQLDSTLSHDRIFPLMPEYFQRYDRQVTV